jgi:hypothetical protein
MQIGVYCYPWDLADEGPDTVCRALRELGASRLHLAATYHRFNALLPHNPARRIASASDSMAYFDWAVDGTANRVSLIAHPEWSRYFAEGVKAAHAAGLSVSAWVVALHYAPRFRKYPDYAVRNLYGDVFAEGLCPSHDAVQDYLLQIAVQLTEHYGVEEIDLESPGWDRFFNSIHGIHERVGVSLGPLDELALSWCFCNACKHRAEAEGIDVEKVRSTLAYGLKETLRRGRGQTGDLAVLFRDCADEVPECKAYALSRARTLLALMTDIRVAAQCDVSTIVYEPLFTGLDPTVISAGVDTLSITAYTADPEEVRRFVTDVRSGVDVSARWRVILSLFERDAPSRTTLQNHLNCLASLDIEDVSFYNYGLASETALERLRGALTVG